ncbi:response regulator [Patescibacteria group bacterium]|nr:response regulator [Patescibacteria group bacterium]
MEKAPKKILVIEDDKGLQQAICDKLKMSGYQVVLARTKNEGIDALIENEDICFIWLDHYLFGQEDGLDFLNEIRHNDQWVQIPLFVISNTASNEKVKTYLALGVDKYFTKAEYKLEEIIDDIKKFVK